MKVYAESELLDLKGISLVYLLDIKVRINPGKALLLYKIKSLQAVEKPSSKVKTKGIIIEKMACIGINTVGNSEELEGILHSKLIRNRYRGLVLPNGNTELYLHLDSVVRTFNSY